MTLPAFSELENPAEFHPRHIGPSDQELQAMLRTVGVASLPALIEAIVPASIRMPQPLHLSGADTPRTEAAVLAALRTLGEDNQVRRNYIGQGYYGTFTPGVILRNVLENPAWYTAYTPYQPEISQGRLEALLNYQTLVCDLTGLPVANASLLDEATAAAEALLLARRASRLESRVFFASERCHPQTLAVLKTRAAGLSIDLVIGDERRGLPECFGALLQYPDTFGGIDDHRALAQQCRDQGRILAVACDLLALTLLAPPGDWGADIALGSAQRFGVPFGFGGPHAAFFACRDEFKRHLPGRLVGVSRDARGAAALRLALQTREQHIRREKATSNICTAQVLLAVMAGMYAVYHGPVGLTRIAQRVQACTYYLAEALRALGCDFDEAPRFDTLTLNVGAASSAIHESAEVRGLNFRRIDAQRIGISLDETVTRADVEAIVAVFADALNRAAPRIDWDQPLPQWPSALRRSSRFLTHPVFHTHHSETSMLRYLRRLADKDLALDRSMIPLGSCTMKLNATTEMLPVTWPVFAQIHPFAPADQTRGYAGLVKSLSQWLCEITGYDAVSLQPNSGAQGEYAGLLAIRAYHAAQGEAGRDVCLIPASAHGTNPASAQLVGLEVVVVRCDDDGNVDLADLRSQVDRHRERLAAIMVTYPSTHGVFEAGIVEICEIVHAAGGQVYLDGANLNALVGVAQPGKFGADVSHLNLHKTFCIPHGGGGPGVGPVAVRAHLAPYLPGVVDATGHWQADDAVGPVSAAPYGSAGILPISWAYIALMGASGLTRATQVAMLSANYLAKRLGEHYPVLYTGQGGWVAHECILDLRPIKERCGVTAEDIAKRLMDYGFHAPTMSFPVAGTLMIEPTESENLHELNRFIDAMIHIRQEIAQIESGGFDREDNPLKHAPHTAECVMADEWTHAYSRQVAAFPLPGMAQAKYWPPVARVDNVHGDRNLVCSCPPLEAYATTAPVPDATPTGMARAA